MRRATSLQTPPHPYAHARPTATVAVNGIARGAWCTRMVGTGGGIFALRRPRPYSRAFAGMALRSKCGHCRRHAHFLHPTCPHEPVVLKRRGTPRRFLSFTPPTYGDLRSLSRRGMP